MISSPFPQNLSNKTSRTFEHRLIHLVRNGTIYLPNLNPCWLTSRYRTFATRICKQSSTFTVPVFLRYIGWPCPNACIKSCFAMICRRMGGQTKTGKTEHRHPVTLLNLLHARKRVSLKVTGEQNRTVLVKYCRLWFPKHSSKILLRPQRVCSFATEVLHKSPKIT